MAIQGRRALGGVQVVVKSALCLSAEKNTTWRVALGLSPGLEWIVSI